jgi:hypothetical protein
MQRSGSGRADRLKGSYRTWTQPVFSCSLNTLARAGFKPTIIAATTSLSGKHRFAAVFEQTSGPIPLTRHNLVMGHADDSGTIQHWARQARVEGWRPTTLTVYGAPGQPLFAGVWEPNPEAIAWNTDGLAETFEEYQRRFDAQFTAWNRPGPRRYQSGEVDRPRRISKTGIS